MTLPSECSIFLGSRERRLLLGVREEEEEEGALKSLSGNWGENLSHRCEANYQVASRACLGWVDIN